MFTISNEIFGLVVLPLLIILARIVDVSLQTLRIIFTSRDKIYIAPLVGFFEVFIWLLAIGQIFMNLTNILYYFAYATGFALGNFLGIYIERKLSIGLLTIRLILEKDPKLLLDALDNAGYGLTTLSAIGKAGEVKMILIIIRRKNLSQVLEIIEGNYPNAFISIEQVHSVKGDILPPTIKHNRFFLGKKRK